MLVRKPHWIGQALKKSLRLKSGKEVELRLPEPGNGPSFFVIGLPKAGSTLLNNIMRPISQSAGYSFFSLNASLRELGIRIDEIAYRKSDVIFDAEGYCYGGFRSIPKSLGLPAYAKGRTLALVRDPRDMLTSLYFSAAYSHRPPQVSEAQLATKFAARRSDAAAANIDEFVLSRAGDLLENYNKFWDTIQEFDARIYKYEDIIFKKRDWIKDITAYLGLIVAENIIDQTLVRVDIVPEKEDFTAHVRTVTPGDHQQKLAAETIKQLNTILEPVLTRYAYT